MAALPKKTLLYFYSGAATAAAGSDINLVILRVISKGRRDYINIMIVVNGRS